jgi:uncharacterized OB-fold protein
MQMKERYVGSFYGHLAEGKLMGQRCATCGTYRLFPVPVCSECQGRDLIWKELSKEGKLLFFSIANLVPARFASYAPCVIGCIHLKDGPVFWTMVEGINTKNQEVETKRLPLDVDIEMKEIAGNIVPIGKVHSPGR